MKLTFKTAKAYLEAGKPFKVKSGAGGERLFVYYNDGRIHDNISLKWTRNEFDNSNFQFISFLPRKQFKVGDKVIITDDIKETEDWGQYKCYFPNMVGKILRVINGKVGSYYEVEGSCGGWTIGAEYLIYDYEANTEEETMPEMDEIKKVLDEFSDSMNKMFNNK